MSQKKTTTNNYRSAVTGRFVPENYAQKNPRITVKEKVARNPIKRK